MCSTASLGQTDTTDYLTQLPAELFLRICELAYHPRDTYLALVSKAFVPFARQRAFGGSLDVYTTASFTKVVDALARGPDAASTVTNLWVSIPLTSDTDQPGTKTFLKALSYMTRLESLIIQAASRLCKAVLSPSKKGLLPRLYHLRVGSPLEGWSNPFSPALYRHIDRYTNLGVLSLHAERRSDTLGRYTTPNPPVRLPFHLKGLHLIGCFFDNPAARDLIDNLSCSAAVLVAEQNYSQAGGMASFLGSLSSPLNISELRIEQRSAVDEDISAVLSRFSNVHTLSFSRGIAVTPLLPVLAGMLKLTDLGLDAHPSDTSLDLRALVEGPHKLKQLQRLTIDVEWRSPRDSEMSARFKNDMVKLVEVCEATPVILDGDVIKEARDALKRRRQREEQEKQEAEARKRGGAAAQW
ncbi:hypothetical protein JCM10449v2_007845 [Rhodotorula kratochvilovae]